MLYHSAENQPSDPGRRWRHFTGGVPEGTNGLIELWLVSISGIAMV